MKSLIGTMKTVLISASILFANAALATPPTQVQVQGIYLEEGIYPTGTRYFKAAICDENGSTLFGVGSDNCSEPSDVSASVVTVGVYTLSIADVTEAVFATNLQTFLRVWASSSETGKFTFVEDINFKPAPFALEAQTAESFIGILPEAKISEPCASFLCANEAQTLTETISVESFAIECPAGFTSVAAAGQQLGCIGDDEEGSAIYEAANLDCANTYGGRLPTVQEWFLAANNFELNDEDDDVEWNANSCVEGSFASSIRDITNFNQSCVAKSANQAYRCWVEK